MPPSAFFHLLIPQILTPLKNKPNLRCVMLSVQVWKYRHLKRDRAYRNLGTAPDHDTTNNPNARPSYCTLNIFHPPQPIGWTPAGNASSYVSNDGHLFTCTNPNNLRQSFHVIFVLDR